MDVPFSARANCAHVRPQQSIKTESLIVAVSFGLGLISCPRRRIAATMEAAIRTAPFSFCFSTAKSIGEQLAKSQIECYTGAKLYSKTGKR